MAIAGSLTYDTKLDTKGFKDGLNKIGGIAKGVAVGVGASITAIGTGLSVLVKNAVDNYAEYEQLTGGVESIFGGIEKGAEQIKKVTDTANEAWKNLTMSQNDYYKNFTSTYPLMKNDIEDQNEAIEQTNRLMTLESDLANTFGYSVEQASTAINWALKGSFNYIDNLNLGIKGTQEGFLEAAHNAGYMVDDVKELTSSDILDILEKTAEQYGVLGKTAEEAMKTIQGSTKATKAAWTNLVTGIADDNADFDKLVNDFVDSVSAMLDNLIPRILTTIEGLGELIPKLIEVLMNHLPEIITTGQNILNALLQGIVENIPQMASTVNQVILSLVDFIIQNLPMILQAGITILLELIKGITEAIPNLIPAIIQCVQTMLSTLIEHLPDLIIAGLDLLLAIVFGIVDNIDKLIDAVLYLIGELIATLSRPDILEKLIIAGIELIIALILGLIKSIPYVIMAIPKIIVAIVDTFKKMDWAKIGKDILKGILNGFLDIGNLIWNAVKKVGNSMMGAIKKFFGIKSPSRLMRDKVGKYLPQGIAVGIEADTGKALDSIDKMNDEIYDRMKQAVNMETGKMAFSGTTGSVSQILSSNATFDGNFVVKAEVQEGTLFEANQRITKEKRLQTGFGG